VFLIGSSLRISGKVEFVQNDSNALGNAAATEFYIDNKVGINSAFQEITISSFKSRRTIEQIRQYPRLLATILPYTCIVKGNMRTRCR